MACPCRNCICKPVCRRRDFRIVNTCELIHDYIFSKDGGGLDLSKLSHALDHIYGLARNGSPLEPVEDDNEP
jgi:hypothetical protein